MFSYHKSVVNLYFLLLTFQKLPGYTSLNFKHDGEKWTAGVVKYKLHKSLKLNDLTEVKKAFDEYHTRTCIKFVPWEENDPDFISLEINNNEKECTRVHRCRQGGSQPARFGDKCRNMGHIISTLGYALCLGREALRQDRDDYISYPETCQGKPEKSVGFSSLGIYDYSSIFHSSCNNCVGGFPIPFNLTSCGFLSSSKTLSVLDVDGINAFYDCQGCHRHRWLPANLLTHEQMTNMYSFGYVTNNDAPLFPCRAVYQQELIVGRYEAATNSCHVYHKLESRKVTSNVEVLTIPGGLEADCAIYKLVKRERSLLKEAVPAGASFERRTWKGYIVYGSVNQTSVIKEDAVGTVWIKNSFVVYNDDDDERGFGDVKAELAVGAIGYEADDYMILTCSLDTICMLEKLYFKEIKENV